MGLRRRHGPTATLVVAAHPGAALATAGTFAALAAASGRTGTECALVGATVLTGQVGVGWLDDLVDRDRDRRAGRQDRPVAMGWVDPGTVSFAIACAVLLVVPLAVANGTAAGVAYLGWLACMWAYHLVLKRGPLSWLPWALGFGLLPAFLSYGGLGGGLHGGPPTWPVTVLAALLGVGVHVLVALPDLVEDRDSGLRHLPLRVALRTGAPRLLWATTAYTAVVGAALVTAALTVGLRQ